MRLGDDFPGGVWMVDLAAVHDPDLVPLAIARAMAIDTRHAPDELTALVAALSHRDACLVVLDNCEHIVESVAATTVTVLGAARDASVLSTSRRPLGVDGEFVRPIQPLADTDSARLFTDRARLTAGTRPTCRSSKRSRSAANWTVCRWRSSWRLAS